MLAALAPASLARMRFPLGGADQAGGARARRARPGCPSPHARESQDLCFLAGTGKARFLARHARLRDAPGRDRRPRRRRRPRRATRGAHHFTVGQRKGLGVAAPSRCTCCARTRRRTRSSSARAPSSRPGASRVRDAACTARARGRRGAAALPRSRPCPAASTATGRTLEELGALGAPRAAPRASRSTAPRRRRSGRLPAARRRRPSATGSSPAERGATPRPMPRRGSRSRATIRSTSATRKRPRIEVLLGRLERRLRRVRVRWRARRRRAGSSARRRSSSRPEVLHDAGAQAGLLGELAAASSSAGAAGASSHAPCGNSQKRSPHRVAELLDQPDCRRRAARSRRPAASRPRRTGRAPVAARAVLVDAASSGSRRRRGWSRRARASSLDSGADDLRRDPRALPQLLREPRPQAAAVRRRSSPPSTIRRCCSPPRACTRSSRTSRAARSRRTTG